MNFQFGEIVLPTTRAYWEDYDENEDVQTEFKPFEWTWMNEDNVVSYPDEVDQFVVFEGHQITDFINTVILKGTSPVCQLTTGCLTVYNLPNTKIVVCVAEEKDLNNFGPLTDMLAPWLDRARQVVGVSFQSAVSYKSSGTEAERQNNTFIRGLNSTLCDVPEMMTPNLLTGVVAGAVCHRMVQDKQASCYAVFMEVEIFDSMSAAPVLQLISDLGIPCEKSYTYRPTQTSNLYL